MDTINIECKRRGCFTHDNVLIAASTSTYVDQTATDVTWLVKRKELDQMFCSMTRKSRVRGV